MLLKKHQYLSFVLLLLAQAFSYGQTREPHSPHDHYDDYCSRMRPEQATSVNRKAKNHSPAGQIHLKPDVAQMTCPSGAEAWAALSSPALVSELKQSDDECFGSFFNIEQTYSPTIFSNANIEAVAAEIYNMSASYDGTKSSGLYGLVYYLHAAIYQDFNNAGVNIGTTATAKYIEACEALTTNPNLFLLTEDALDILSEYLILLDFPGLRHKTSVLNVVKRVMTDLAINETWKQVPSEIIRSYSLAYNRIFFLMFRGIQDDDYVKAVNGDAAYFDLIYAIATSSELQNNYELGFMTTNAISELARAAESALLLDDVEGLLAQIANNFPRLSTQWLTAIEAINTYGNCATYSLCENMEDVKSELDDMLFPNTFSFDDGKIIVKTPLDEEEVQGLYHAAKQSQNQFFRMLQTDEPVAGDVNEALNIVVFGSKQQYEAYVTYLFDIPSNNGGMYIERGATFYTWDRTVGVESSLSLEALFRHEYTHYLQGRYLIPGYWGEGEIYNDSRLVWYEEGMAEFFAGSTETDGIKLLASNAGVATYNENDWPSLNTVLNSSYTSGNFYHYHYGNMVWYNFYLNDFDKIKTFFDLTRNNDVTGFDNLVNELKSTGETDFSNFLSQVANGTVQGWEPETSWLNDDYLAIGSVDDIESEFIDITAISAASASIDATTLNRRFRIDGAITGSGSVDNNADASKAISEALDSLLLEIRANPLLNNFNYTIGYFKNLNYDSGIPTADFVISGPLKDANISDTPVPDFTAQSTVAIAGGDIPFQNLSTGYIKSLQWSFPGGSPSTVTDETNPTIGYADAGTYDVTLSVTGSEGAVNKIKPAYIKVYERSNQSYCAGSGSREDNYVTRVTFGSIDNPSEYQNYSDFTSLVTEVAPGGSQTLTIGAKNSYWESNAVGAWIDWNSDGDFDDAEEEIYSQFGTGPYEVTVNVPSDAVAGVTNLRIRIAYGSEDKIVACGDDNYIGEVEDYSIVISTESSTTKPVAAFTASKTTVSAGESLTFTDQSANTPTAWAWTFAGGSPATSTEQNPEVSFTTPGVYDVSLTVSNAAGSDTKTINGYITVEEASGTMYCTSSSVRAAYEYIANVEIGDFSNPSDTSLYSDFTHLTVNLNKGDNPVTLTPGFLDIAFDEYFRVWIDFNQDGDFDDSDELAFDAGSASSTSVSGTIAVPASALTGSTRMRVSMQFESAPEACGPLNDGEVEDYTVEINETTINAPGSLTAEATSFTVITLNWVDNSDDEDGFEIERALDGGEFEVVASVEANVTSYANGGLDTNTTYTYRIRAQKGAIYSDYSDLASATTPNPDYCAADNNTAASRQYIKRVKIGTINNSSSYVPGGYSDYSSHSANITASTKLTVTPHEAWAETKAKAWIDWNRDGDFDDLGEEVLNAGGADANYHSVITIPAGTIAGDVRLRVRVALGETPTACGSITMSEVEDYTLKIEDLVSSSKFGEAALANGLNLYPNPSKNSRFHLTFPRYAGDLEITVTTLQGTVIYTNTIPEQATDIEHFTVELNERASGMYLVHVKNRNETVVKKIYFE